MFLLIAAALLLGVWLIAALLIRRDGAQAYFKVWAASGIVVILAAGILVSFQIEHEDVASGSASAPDLRPWPEPAPVLASAEQTDRQVAPSVESLIGPLEKRLASHPEDAKGWALLAQSYAYVGDDAAAEVALAKAVAAGFDEDELRASVRAAERSRPHDGDWIRQAIGG